MNTEPKFLGFFGKPIINRQDILRTHRGILIDKKFQALNINTTLNE